MDRATMELAAIEATVNEVTEAQLRELNELQLALVGGGAGPDPIYA